MGFDELLFLAKGLVKGWNKEKLKKKIQETAKDALDNRVKVAELEEILKQKEDEIRRLKGEVTRDQTNDNQRIESSSEEKT
jgi:hypothetical protein